MTSSPKAEARDAIIVALRQYRDEHMTWPLTENMIADALSELPAFRDEAPSGGAMATEDEMEQAARFFVRRVFDHFGKGRSGHVSMWEHVYKSFRDELGPIAREAVRAALSTKAPAEQGEAGYCTRWDGCQCPSLAMRAKCDMWVREGSPPEDVQASAPVEADRQSFDAGWQYGFSDGMSEGTPGYQPRSMIDMFEEFCAALRPDTVGEGE